MEVIHDIEVDAFSTGNYLIVMTGLTHLNLNFILDIISDTIPTAIRNALNHQGISPLNSMIPIRKIVLLIGLLLVPLVDRIPVVLIGYHHIVYNEI